MEKPLVILASARRESETLALLNTVFAGMDPNVFDLLDHHIAPYDYSNNYPPEDGFLKIVEVLLQHPAVVFATPVYWYAMSGLLKTFFDRLTDLVTVQKKLGRQLKGKTTFLIAIGADPELPEGFEVPFRLTSDYLDMAYQGCLYHSTKHAIAADVFQQQIMLFKSRIENCCRC